MESSGEGFSDLTLASNSSTFMLLMYGRLTVDLAMTVGLLTAEGDLGLIPDFDHWLEGD